MATIVECKTNVKAHYTAAIPKEVDGEELSLLLVHLLCSGETCKMRG